jgi:hypothetical protein
MPTISSFFGIVIRMYYDDHMPPHFHAYYAEHDAALTIETLEVLEGNLPKRAFSAGLRMGGRASPGAEGKLESCNGA